jgi:hypothetical protein
MRMAGLYQPGSTRQPQFSHVAGVGKNGTHGATSPIWIPFAILIVFWLLCQLGILILTIYEKSLKK